MIAEIRIRKAEPKDFERIEEMLIQNDMLKYPDIDGKKAMRRIYEKSGEYFLVAEINNYVIGMVRGCYDGSRALIHQIVVDKNYQGIGIGKKLINEIASRFKLHGAPTVSITSTEESENYYKELGFLDLPIKLMVAFNINDIINKTKTDR